MGGILAPAMVRSSPKMPQAFIPRVGCFTAASLLVSNIIGGAIFTTTGFLARDIGDPLWILTLWFFGGLLALAGAMSYAEMAAALPHAGGDYVYLRTTYHPVIGFLSGWTSFTTGFGAALAASCMSFAAYAARLGPGLPEDPLIIRGLALALLWAMTVIHAAGTGPGGTVQRLFTTTNMLAMGGLIVGGLLLGQGDWTHFESAGAAPPGKGMVVVALIFILYTYLGWNVVGYIAGEIVDPARNLPKVLIGGTAFVAAIYLLLNVVYIYALPISALAEPPILPVAEKSAAALWGPGSAQFLTILICIAIAAGVSAMVWAGPRVYWAMAQDGALPRFLSTLHARTGVPLRALLLQSIWASVLILSGTYERLVIFSGFVLAGFTALTVTGVLVLRWRRPDLPRPYHVPTIVPVFAIVVLLAIVVTSLHERPLESVLGVATVLAGLPLYWLWKPASRKC